MALRPDRISRDEAFELLGRQMFGTNWVGERTADEFKLMQRYRGRLKPEDPKEAEKLYLAQEREARQDRQYRQVVLWLEDRGFDCVRGRKSGFCRDRFDAEFFKAFRAPAAVPQKKTRHPGDIALIAEALAAIRDGRETSALGAARLVYLRAEGPSPEANLERLRKAIGAALRAGRPNIANHRQC